MINPPFFIIGSQRSGTTLLRLILNKHSEISIPEEGTFWMPYLRKIDYKRSLHFNPNELNILFRYIRNNSQFKLWGFEPTKVENDLKKIDKPTFNQVMSCYYREFAKLNNKNRWGDKTPSFFRKIKSIKRVFNNAKFIHIVRDGRDVYLSQRKMNNIHRSVSIGALEWCYKVKKAKKALNQYALNSYIEIRYEDLIKEPEKKISEICNFIGVKYESNMLDFYKSSNKHINIRHSKLIFAPINNKNTQKWKKYFTNSMDEKFQIVAQKELVHYGYISKNQVYHRKEYISVVFELLFGIPKRFYKVINTASKLHLAARFGKSTDASGGK